MRCPWLSPQRCTHPFLSLSRVYAIFSAITSFMILTAADGLNLCNVTMRRAQPAVLQATELSAQLRPCRSDAGVRRQPARAEMVDSPLRIRRLYPIGVLEHLDRLDLAAVLISHSLRIDRQLCRRQPATAADGFSFREQGFYFGMHCLFAKRTCNTSTDPY